MTRSGNRIIVRVAGVFWPLLLMHGGVANAAEPGSNAINTSQEVACMPQDCDLFQIDDRVLAVLPYPQRYYPPVSDETGALQWSDPDIPPGFRNGDEDFDIGDDQHWLLELSELESLSLKTFWENQDSRLFLGVDKDGFAGLMFGQKDRDSRARASDDDEFSYMDEFAGREARPLLHSQSLNYEQPDLSQKTGIESD